MNRTYFLIFIFSFALLFGINVSPTAAHDRIEIGEYVVVVGWVTEPAIVGERNALFLEITQNEQPVVGAESTLDAELIYADRTFRANLTPTITPGQYIVEFYPTVRGQYSAHIFGSLNDFPIDQTLSPEEVFSADRIQFPEPEPSIRELQRDTQRQISELQQSVSTARSLAIGGLIFGLIGTALAAWQMKKRTN